MADLDDFFAKKDRKKASKGKKFTTTEEIAKKLEETGKKAEKPKPKEKLINPEGTEDNQSAIVEDEWKDYEEEEKKDYTGLKIGNLTVTETVMTESDDDRATGENSSDGEVVDGVSKHSGPWKISDVSESEPSNTAVAVTEPPTDQKPKNESASQPSAYVPPSLRRNKQAPQPSRLRNKNIAPDIHNEEYFPTLNSKSAVPEVGKAWGKLKKDEGTFEEVRNKGGSRTYGAPESQNQSVKLSLGNKFGSLSQDQS